MNEVLELIDTEWIKNNPDSALELIQLMWDDKKRIKEYVKILERQIQELNKRSN